MSPKPKHALLRDRTHWEGTSTTRLQQTDNGELTLVRLPAGAPVDLPSPWETDASGLAIAENGLTCISDTEGNQLLCVDPLCNARTRVTGFGLAQPRGLLIAGDLLYVADSGNARVQVFDLGTLELRSVWQGTCSQPTGLAADSEGRNYVLDADLQTLLRFSATGVIDKIFNATMVAHAELAAPAFLVIDDHDVLYVSERTQNRVLRFDAEGHCLGALEALGATLPRALAVGDGRLYVADAASGELRAFDLETGVDLGALPGFRGPVTALCIDHTGALRIKTDLGSAVVTLRQDLGCVPRGHLLAGPLDAGVNQTWERVVVTTTRPAGSRVRLEVYLASSSGAVPHTGDWIPANALDTLVPPPPGDGAASARFLWLRVELSSRDRRHAPSVSQVQATTTARSYIDHLPAVYAREDRENGFLRRWLALFRAELGDSETLLVDMARRFDPAMAPEDHLNWLAGWLAFELPDQRAPAWSIRWLRELILEAHDIYTRRGTKAGLREAIERHTGTRPQIMEAYRERRIWQLGAHSRLGFDTGLAPARPDGAVVPDSNEKLVVGEFVLNRSGPQEADDLGEPLFDEEAHLFSVVLPAGNCIDEAERTRLRAIIDAEKPAHTDYRLCLIEPRMRVGFQARVGIDSIVAGPPEPLALNVSRLGLGSFVGDGGSHAGSRVGYRSSIGQTTRVG